MTVTKAVAHPRRVVRALVGVIALNLAGNLVTGLAIVVCIAVGMALAG
ncbi:hypothetical protein [Mesorhizobium temperatum]|nr:hypothetical protein [Mesorhizobium temperatum]